MQEKSPQIVFMGTPDLAVHMLDAICNKGYQVVAVVTAPDRPAGRGRKLQQSPVKLYALGKDIPVLQPENLKNQGFIEELQAYKPDLQVVVAFRMLPESVWKIPKMGTFNLHASLLPNYRGAAPINWVIINGEKETGVTTFLIDHKIDTGNILLKEKITIDEFETAASLHEKVKQAGAPLVIKTIEGLMTGNIKAVKQENLINDEKTLNKAPKIFKDHCCINWENNTRQIVNLIHGLNPNPGAFTMLEDHNNEPFIIKLFEARPEIIDHDHKPGSLLTDNKTFLKFATPDGFVKILKLQLPGKKKLHVYEVLRGYQFMNPPCANKG